MARTKNDVAQAESGSPEASKAVVSGKTGRPRGRPRKENKVVKVPSGRPRGRPKGSTKAVAIQKTMESRGASQTEIDAAVAAGTPAKRLSSRRGRPPKAATPSKSKATATPSSAGKRGRGRPKKGPAAPSKEEEPVEENEASAAEDAEGEDDDGIDAVADPAADNNENDAGDLSD